MLPLEGIKVLDLSIMYAGPGTAMYLGDMGAEIIKVEQVTGDDSRLLGSSPFLGKNSRFYMAVNRNKKAILLDLQSAHGQEIMHRLASDADIILHNFRPGVAERLGVGYEQLSELNPQLVYVWMTGFGSKGPYADKQAYDNIIQGYSGVYDARMQRYGDPSGAGTFIADTAAPMLLGFAIGAALFERERTGRGQIIEGSLLGVALASQASQWVRCASTEHAEPEIPEECCPVFRCAGEQYLTVGLVTDAEWQAFCGVLGRPDLADDARFSTTEVRGEHRRELEGMLAEALLSRPRDEWESSLLAAGVPCTPVVLRSEMKDLPHAVENDLFARVQHPTVGSTVVFNIPVQLSETPGTIRSAAPAFGGDTDEVLRELGYSPDEIKRFRSEQVVA